MKIFKFKKKIKIIKLEELSKIWLPPAIINNPDEKEEDDYMNLNWENKQVQLFWDKYIRNTNFNNFKNIKLIKLILITLDSQSTSSIDKNDNEISKGFFKLSNTSLLDHSLNVAIKIYDILKNNPNHYVDAEIGIIIGLSHDIGLINKDNYSHSKKSAKWLRDNADHPELDRIIEIVVNHHNNDFNNCDLSTVLRHANELSRDEEILKLNKVSSDILSLSKQTVFDYKSIKISKIYKKISIMNDFKSFHFRGKVYLAKDRFLDVLEDSFSKQYERETIENNLNDICKYFKIEMQKILIRYQGKYKPQNSDLFVFDGSLFKKIPESKATDGIKTLKNIKVVA
ncbi:MAG: HD domain-containing protein [Desulfobacterales bacterium]|nr:HD domain-containing protein [Desulfobacterales bacterium]